MNSIEKGIFDHLDDLTSLLIRTGIIYVISATLCLVFTPKLFKIIVEQLLDNYSITIGTISPIEILMCQIKLAAIGGLIVSMPINIPLVWSYIKPALTFKERKAISISLLPGIALFITGAVFAYIVILPLAIGFLSNLAMQFHVEAFWTISSCISLILSLGFAFGIAFELPVVILVLGRIGIVTHKGLSQSRRYVIVGLLIFAAIITPPDVVSQLLLTLPLLLLYEISIFLLRTFRAEKG